MFLPESIHSLFTISFTFYYSSRPKMSSSQDYLVGSQDLDVIISSDDYSIAGNGNSNATLVEEAKNYRCFPNGTVSWPEWSNDTGIPIDASQVSNKN